MSSTPATVLRLPEDLNQQTLEGFKATVEPHVEIEGPGMVFDLQALDFVNSIGLGYIVSVGKRLADRQRRLALARPSRHVEKLIRMVGLGEMLPMFKSLDDATRHVQR